MVNLLHGIHAAIGLGEQAFDVETVLRTKRRPDAEAHQFAAGNFSARFDRQLVKAASFFVGCFCAQPGSDHDEFIAAHARDIIVAAADFLHAIGKILEQVVAFEMPVEIVNLFEVVEVADHHSEGGAGAAAARQFARQVNEQRARVG